MGIVHIRASRAQTEYADEGFDIQGATAPLKLSLHNWSVTLAGQLRLHRLGILERAKRTNLHVVELVIGDGIVHHEDVVVFLAQRTGECDSIVFAGNRSDLHDDGSWAGHGSRAATLRRRD